VTTADLPESWRTRAAELRRWAAAEGAATALEAAAAELEAAVRAAEDQELTLAEAADESGLSERRLRELIAAGDVPQAGRRGRPRIRRGDLPVRRKASRPAPSPYDPRADARRLLGS
jgi:multidrug efflux pump subunit AcrA (membrane-fusion protein)